MICESFPKFARDVGASTRLQLQSILLGWVPGATYNIISIRFKRRHWRSTDGQPQFNHEHSNMRYPTTIFNAITAIITSTATSPLPQRDQYYGVSIAFIVSNGTVPPIEPVAWYAPVELNKFLSFTPDLGGIVYASELKLQTQVSGGLNPNAIQCRGYRHIAGTQPVQKTFTVKRSTVSSRGTMEVGSLLCYVAGELGR
jgi:hypothetical protein